MTSGWSFYAWGAWVVIADAATAPMRAAHRGMGSRPAGSLIPPLDRPPGWLFVCRFTGRLGAPAIRTASAIEPPPVSAEKLEAVCGRVREGVSGDVLTARSDLARMRVVIAIRNNPYRRPGLAPSVEGKS